MFMQSRNFNGSTYGVNKECISDIEIKSNDGNEIVKQEQQNHCRFAVNKTKISVNSYPLIHKRLAEVYMKDFHRRKTAVTEIIVRCFLIFLIMTTHIYISRYKKVSLSEHEYPVPSDWTADLMFLVPIQVASFSFPRMETRPAVLSVNMGISLYDIP